MNLARRLTLTFAISSVFLSAAALGAVSDGRPGFALALAFTAFTVASWAFTAHLLARSSPRVPA